MSYSSLLFIDPMSLTTYRIEEGGFKVYQCVVCSYETRVKTNVKEHVEAKHMESTHVQCPYCLILCPNKKSLRNHTYKYHRS